MKFKIRVVEPETGRAWWETYDEDTDDPKAYAEAMLENFNATLRPHEKARRIGGLITLNTANDFHKWEKLTSGQSVLYKGQVVDLYQCANCQITGKRFGLHPTIVRDHKYMADKYAKCPNRK
ncbi:hypothetical protein [Vibrio phage vB_VneS_J26]